MVEETTELMQNKANVNPNLVKNLCYDIQAYMQNIKKCIDNVSDFTDGYYTYYSDDTKNTFVNKKKNYMFSKENILSNISSYIDEYNTVVSKFQTHDISFTPNKVFDENN